MPKVGGDVNSNIVVKKVKNLLKTKNIEKLVKFKKSDFTKTKTNKVSKTGFCTFEAIIAFTQLKKNFIKAQIFCDFDLEYHIWMEIDALGYTISRVLVAFFFPKTGIIA